MKFVSEKRAATERDAGAGRCSGRWRCFGWQKEHPIALRCLAGPGAPRWVAGPRSAAARRIAALAEASEKKVRLVVRTGAREKFESQSPFPITLWEAKRKRKEKCSCAVGFSANRSASRIAREHVYSARSGAVCAPVTTERKKVSF